jgi:hypothetical protein
MLLLKSLILVFSIEGGYMPNSALISNIGTFLNPYGISIRNNRETYVDMQSGIEIMKLITVSGGMRSYQSPVFGRKLFYPFRMDFNVNAELKYRGISIGYHHGCDHSFTPFVNQEVEGKIDYAINRIFLRAEIRKAVF